MKFPLSADDVKNEIIICCYKADKIGDLRIRQLISVLKKVPDEFIIEGVIQIFESNNPYFPHQKYCGMILSDLNPKPKEQPGAIMEKIIKYWDKSHHQFSTWFKINFGIEEVKLAIDQLAEFESDLEKIDKLKTMKWWLDRENLF